jgi:hypothetical protein
LGLSVPLFIVWGTTTWHHSRMLQKRKSVSPLVYFSSSVPPSHHICITQNHKCTNYFSSLSSIFWFNAFFFFLFLKKSDEQNVYKVIINNPLVINWRMGTNHIILLFFFWQCTRFSKGDFWYGKFGLDEPQGNGYKLLCPQHFTFFNFQFFTKIKQRGEGGKLNTNYLYHPSS